MKYEIGVLGEANELKLGAGQIAAQAGRLFLAGPVVFNEWRLACLHCKALLRLCQGTVKALLRLREWRLACLHCLPLLAFRRAPYLLP